jgi:hypothetical protein
MPVNTNYARHIIDVGFVGESLTLVDEDGGWTGESAQFICFADAHLTEPGDERSPVAALINNLMIDGSFAEGCVLVSIDVPEDIVLNRLTDDVSRLCIWLDPEAANAYRKSLVIYDEDGNEIPPDLVGR